MWPSLSFRPVKHEPDIKADIRNSAKAIRATLVSTEASRALITLFPNHLNHNIVAGFAPIGNEIDVWPLLQHLNAEDRQIVLPVVSAPGSPLSFRAWSPASEMTTDKYGVSYPAEGSSIAPKLILVPLLAYTARGDRLGYGGGYYDRTLAQLRGRGDVFACGVAYAGQEVLSLPTDDHDERLDGILTEDGFRRF